MEFEPVIAIVALAIAVLAPGLTWWLHFTPKGSLLRDAQLVNSLPADSAARPIMLQKLDTRLLMRQWQYETYTRNLKRGRLLVLGYLVVITAFFLLARFDNLWVDALRFALVGVYAEFGRFAVTDLMKFRRDEKGRIMNKEKNTAAWQEWREGYYKRYAPESEIPTIKGDVTEGS